MLVRYTLGPKGDLTSSVASHSQHITIQGASREGAPSLDPSPRRGLAYAKQ